METITTFVLLLMASAVIALTVHTAFKVTSSTKTAIILLIVLFLAGALETALPDSQPRNKRQLSKDDYGFWKDLTEGQKTFYMYGVFSGMVMMATEIAYNSGYVDLLQMAEEKLPDYDVRSYIAFIDGVYQDPSFRKVPIYLLIMRAEKYTKERYGEQY